MLSILFAYDCEKDNECMLDIVKGFESCEVTVYSEGMGDKEFDVLVVGKAFDRIPDNIKIKKRVIVYSGTNCFVGLDVVYTDKDYYVPFKFEVGTVIKIPLSFFGTDKGDENVTNALGGRVYKFKQDERYDQSKLYGVLQRCEYFVCTVCTVNATANARAVMDAMANGVIVIAIGINMYLKEHFPGDCLIYADSQEDAIEKIHFLEKNVWLKTQLRARAEKYVRENMSLKNVRQAWNEMLAGLVDKVYYTVFAGRRANLEIQFRYIDRLLDMGLIHEVHLWDFTRNAEDAAYLKKIGKYQVFHVDNKDSWGEYYSYYGKTFKAFKTDCVVIKADDDIVYLDVDKFGDFIKHVKSTEFKDGGSLYAFPSIVNNGVTSHHQQQYSKYYGSIGVLPYDPFFGRLVCDGALATKVHTHFLNYIESYKGDERVLKHKIGDRISINFFAINGRDLHVFLDIGWDDEHDVSVTVPKRYGRGAEIYMGFIVAHLGFAPQRKTGLEEDKLRKRYKKIGTIL